MMMKLVTVEEMIAIEKQANSIGLSYPMMMNNAGNSIFKIIMENYSHYREEGTLGLIGSGNNGGDTLIALTLLAENSWKTSAYIVNMRERNDPLIVQYLEAGGNLYEIAQDNNYDALNELLFDNSLLLDGILGTGIRLPLRQPAASILKYINETIHSNNLETLIIAIDCPSGIDCDTGETAQFVLPANLTITMAAVKQGLLKFPAYNYVGELRLAGIGLPITEDELSAWHKIQSYVADSDWVRCRLPERPLDSHKGTFGSAIIVSGSVSYSGAPLLAGEAAYRAGAGLVTLAVPGAVHQIIAGQIPECTWVLLSDIDGFISDNAVQQLIGAMERATSFLIGPGLSQKQQTANFIIDLFKQNYPFPPTVIDADGLRLIKNIDGWERKIPKLCVLTPHPGEMSALTDISIQEIQSNRREIAIQYSKRWGHIIALKGAFTVIANPDGKCYMIPIASPALARAGSGDVLAGLISGYLAQGVAPFEAAVISCWIHAMAGLSALYTIGNSASVLAGDILAEIPDVINQLKPEYE